MRRIVTAGALFAVALIWVGMLSLLFGSRSTPSSKPADDGSQAIIKYLDKSNFYKDGSGEVSLRMDILDPHHEPLLGLSKDTLKVTEHGAPAVVKAFNGPGTQPVNLILVIDMSGSMGDQGKMQGAIAAALAAIEELLVGRDRIGIIAFDDRFEVLQSLDRLTAETKLVCRQKIGSLRPRGGTIIGVPTLSALQIFEQTSPDGPKVVMVMTDGEDDSLPPLIETIAERSDTTGVPVYTISFGDLGNPAAETVLRQLAQKCSAQYYHAPTAQQLAEIYRSQVQELTREFTVLYDSPYPQADGLPRRVEVQISAPAGTLVAATTYQIGSIVDSGATRAPANSGKGPAAMATIASAFLKCMIFTVLFVLLAAGLAVPSLMPRGKFSLAPQTAIAQKSQAATRTTTPPVRSLAPSVRPPPPPPPGKRPSPVKPVSPAASSPVAATTSSATEQSLSSTAPTGVTKGSTPLPAPAAARPPAPAALKPPPGKPGEKQTIRPVPPPPPPRRSG